MWIRFSPIAVLMMLALAHAMPAHAEQITIYRCTDAKGKQTLRDSPCKRGEKQQTQEMVRPRDAKPAISRTPSASRSRDIETVRYVVQHVPRPLYTCVTPDGQQYLSESAEGQQRWVPGWVVPTAPYPRVLMGRDYGDVGWRGPRGSIRIGSERRYIAGAPVLGGPVHGAPVIATGGYWMRDACSAMSTSETCEVLSDRRYQIRVRYSQAMPSERSLLDRESATLDNRLRQECGA